MELVNNAIDVYRKQFGSDPTVAAFAPGRVNLIGEHTDYNDGFVLPFALPHKTVIVGSLARNTSETTIVSCAKGLAIATFEINGELKQGDPEWANYIKGAIFQYLKELPPGIAFNAAIVGDVPIGSGLSSSASLEVATSTFLEALCGISSVSGVDKALRCQKAEHTFAGMPCGIMDQYISAMGKEGNLLLIDCRSNEYTLVPYGAGPEVPIILVTNSNVKHQLTGSEYPDRVRQCKEAVALLQQRFPEVKALRDATLEMLEEVRLQMSDLVYRRARHSVSEDRRTLATVRALEDKDYATVGRLMTESHRSLQHDYEVSCVELDKLVDIALSVDGVYGSRMTGGGFGGCTVTLVKPSAVKALEQALHTHYWKQAHRRCDCYETLPDAGAGIILLAPYLLDRPFDRAGTNSAVHAGAGSEASVADGTEAGAAVEVIASGSELVVGSSLWEEYKWPAIATLVAVTAAAAFVVFRKRN